jgi:methylase of polypeptide subunit release factors
MNDGQSMAEKLQERLRAIDKVAPDDVDNDIVVQGISLKVKAGVFNPNKGKSAPKMLRMLDLLPPEPNAKILEIGTGCGILSAAMWLRGCRNITALDIMDLACENARENFQHLKMPIPVLTSDLFSAASEPFDYVVFNAPAAHPDRFNTQHGAVTLWDESGTLKKRFVDGLRAAKPEGRLRAIFMYSKYYNYDPFENIEFSSFELSKYLIVKDDISETGVVMLSRD